MQSERPGFTLPFRKQTARFLVLSVRTFAPPSEAQGGFLWSSQLSRLDSRGLFFPFCFLLQISSCLQQRLKALLNGEGEPHESASWITSKSWI